MKIFKPLDIWNIYSNDVGKALIHLGALGWFLSSAAQITMIAANNDIDKKEKKFLIPQEIADGLINVGLYYSICQGTKHAFEYITENGCIMTSKTAKTIMDMKPQPDNKLTNFVQGLAETFRSLKLVDSKKQTMSLTNFFEGSINYLKNKKPKIQEIELFKQKYPKNLNPFKKYNTPTKIQKQIETLKATQENFNNFKNGIGVIAAVGASILSCNIITPIARNITANHFQKKHLKQTAFNPPKQSFNPVKYTYNPSKTFNNFKI